MHVNKNKCMYYLCVKKNVNVQSSMLVYDTAHVS